MEGSPLNGATFSNFLTTHARQMKFSGNKIWGHQMGAPFNGTAKILNF